MPPVLLFRHAGEAIPDFRIGRQNFLPIRRGSKTIETPLHIATKGIVQVGILAAEKPDLTTEIPLDMSKLPPPPLDTEEKKE